jgi:hypothetical protein
VIPWKPLENSKWQKEALCSRKEYEPAKEWFFSEDPGLRYAAKVLCYECPVRRQCLQTSLESRQIWGVWGGKDECQTRRTLSVLKNSEETRRRRPSNCPYCGAKPSQLSTETVDLPGGGRWTTAKIVHCKACEFSWRSRTSANAVEAYQSEREAKLAKSEKQKTRKSRKPSSAQPIGRTHSFSAGAHHEG